MKGRKISVNKYNPSPVQLFRKQMYKKGFELINVTTLCEYKLGTSGWCNDLNEPDETIHHIQVWYRDEVVANISGLTCAVIDEDRYIIFHVNEDDCTGADFIIFRKVKL